MKTTGKFFTKAQTVKLFKELGEPSTTIRVSFVQDILNNSSYTDYDKVGEICDCLIISSLDYGKTISNFINSK